MTQLLAHTDAYLKEFDAVVVAINTEENDSKKGQARKRNYYPAPWLDYFLKMK